MPRFPGVDYLSIDSQFSEQELMVRQTARQFVDDRVSPVIRDCFRDATIPHANWFPRWAGSVFSARIWKATAAPE